MKSKQPNSPGAISCFCTKSSSGEWWHCALPLHGSLWQQAIRGDHKVGFECYVARGGAQGGLGCPFDREGCEGSGQKRIWRCPFHAGGLRRWCLVSWCQAKSSSPLTWGLNIMQRKGPDLIFALNGHYPLSANGKWKKSASARGCRASASPCLCRPPEAESRPAQRPSTRTHGPFVSRSLHLDVWPRKKEKVVRV